MNKTGSTAWTIKYKGQARKTNGRRMVYGHWLSHKPRENVGLGINELSRLFPQDKNAFTIHKTRIKRGDCLMPIRNKADALMWA